MDARLLSLLVLSTVGLGCSASHPGETPDVGTRDAAGVDAFTATRDGGGMDAPGPAGDAGLDVGGGARACDGPSGCVLRPASCCGSCGAATPEDMIALARDEVDAYVTAICEDIGCPECAREADPYLLATCSAGTCVAVDLHTDPRTECNDTSDCTLAPRECCACGTLTVNEVIAFNPARGSIASLTCDPDADCPPCVPDFGGISPICDAGRCEVRGAD